MEMVDYERLLEHTEELASELLRLRMIKDEGKAKEIARMFVREFKHHGKAITIDECIVIGLNVEEMKEEEWKIVWEFNKLWEEIANIKGEVGSKIIALEIGDGIAFVPSLREKEPT